MVSSAPVERNSSATQVLIAEEFIGNGLFGYRERISLLFGTLQRVDIMIQLNDFSATLGIDGFLSISPQGAYHFNATLIPRSG